MGALRLQRRAVAPPYQFNWETGATGATANNLISGTCYGLTITDDCGQQTLTCFEVPAVADLVVQNVEIMAPCINSANGSAVATVSGGRAPFIFRWVNDSNSDWANGGVAITSSPEIGDLPEGNYTLTVFEDCGSLVDFSFTIDGVDPPEIFAAPAQVTRSCPDADLGAIDITLNALGQGGSIEWSTGAQTEDISGLAAGEYTLTVVLEDGCVVEKTFTVREFEPEIILTPVPCASKETGDIEFSFSSNSYHGPYSVSWSNGETWDFTAQPYQNTLSGLAPGIYSATVTSASPACEIVVSEEVSDNDQPVITLVDYMAETDNPLIGGASDGFLEIAVTGSDNYTISWDNGASTSALYEGLSAGWYAVVVTSLETGCSATASFYVESCPPSIVRIEPYPISVTPPATSGDNGSINIVVHPNSGSFTYHWEGPDGPMPGIQTSLSGLSPGEYCVTVVDDCGRRDEACFEIFLETSCPKWFVDMSTNNQCGTRKSNPRKFIFDNFNSNNDADGYIEDKYEIGDRFKVTWRKEGTVIHNSQFEITEFDNPYYDEINWIQGNNYITAADDTGFRYSVTIQDKYGCEATYWADFLSSNSTGFGIARTANLNDNTNNWTWNINEGSYPYVTATPPFADFSDYWYWVNNAVGVGNLGAILHCGYIYDWPHPRDRPIYSRSEDDWYQQVFGPFCFIPSSESTISENICRLGGTIYAPGYGWFDVLPNSGRKIEAGNKCGCLFPLSAFESSPIVLKSGNYVPIHLMPGIEYIYANCPSSCPEDSPPPVVVEEDTQECLYEFGGLCFKVSYISHDEEQPELSNDCQIVGVEQIEDCNSTELMPCPSSNCPVDQLQPYWCDDYNGSEPVCRFGIFNDLNQNNDLDTGEPLYFQSESSDMEFCDQLQGQGVYSLSDFCSPSFNECFPIEGSLSYDADFCNYDGCDCFIDVACGDGIQTIQGEIVSIYVDGQDEQYACPEMCNDGFFCMRMSSCDFSNSSMSDLPAVYIETKLETLTKTFNPWIDCDPDVPSGDPLAVPCLEEYRCGTSLSEGDSYSIHTFCNPNCASGIIEYPCTGSEPVPCENFTPVVIENRSQGTDSSGRKIVRTDFAIVPDNAFRVSSVFPNPFSQQLTIKLTASYAGNAQVNLVNLLGQVVHTERHEFIRGYTPIQVSTSALGLTPGLYQVVVTDELGNYYTEKIMYQP